MSQLVNKTVNLDLVGHDENIFNLIGVFTQQARKEGWTKEEIETVTEAVHNSENYDMALAIIVTHCSLEEEIEIEDDEDEVIIDDDDDDEDEDGFGLDENDDFYDDGEKD